MPAENRCKTHDDEERALTQCRPGRRSVRDTRPLLRCRAAGIGDKLGSSHVFEMRPVAVSKEVDACL